MTGGCVTLLRCAGILLLALAFAAYATVPEDELLGRSRREVTKAPVVSKVPPLKTGQAGGSKGTQPPATKTAKDESDKGQKGTVAPAGPSDEPPAVSLGSISKLPGATASTTAASPAGDGVNIGVAAVPQPTESMGSGDASFTLSFEESPVYIYEGEVKNLTIVYVCMSPRIMQLKSSDENMFVVASNATVLLEPTIGADNGTVIVTLRGVRLGVTKLQLVILDPLSEYTQPQLFLHLVKTKRVLRLIDSLFDYMLLPLVMIATCGMGCKLDTDLIKSKLRRPIPVLVGPVCQFICMPLVALSISKMFKFDPLTAMGLITVGSCPGGGLSNMITLLVDADLIMSVTMTFLSTCLALGMLPLNLFIYSRFYFSGNSEEEGGITLPITNIIMQISFLTIPLLLGMLLRAKLPKIAQYVIKCLNVLSLTLILLTLGVGLYSNTYIIFSPSLVLLGGFLHPTLGFIIGFLMAKFLARFPTETAVTVSVETGVQNNLIAISMLKLSYDQPEADIMARMPMIVAISSVSIGIGMIIASLPINRRRTRKEKRAKELRDVSDKYDYRPVALSDTAEGESGGESPTGKGENGDAVPAYDMVVVEKKPFEDSPETVV